MSHPFVSHFQCTICGAQYEPDAVTYTCPVCGPAGTLDIVYNYRKLHKTLTAKQLTKKTPPTMWRYGPLLPIIEPSYIPPLPIGWTPLLDVPRLANVLVQNQLWLKDDGRNPTASLKDRASAMVVARALQMKAPVVTTASTGNAAAALAGVCASVGMRAVIFVPAKAPPAKIAQLLVYGATVLLVDGTYDQAFDLCVQAAEEYGWYCRNTGMNPYTTEGKKTAALEIAEQLGWKPPDVVLVSVGDGSIIGGQYKGWHDLYELGWIEHMPRLIGVQAEGSSSVAKAWRDGTDPATMQPGPADTIADSISASLPRDRVKAVRAARATNGAYVTVSDQDILAAIPELAQHSGVFAEPASAAAYAGLKEARKQGLVSPDDRVVLLLTGSGLKDVNSAMKSVGAGYPVAAEIADVRRVVEQQGLAR
ncbi:MAG: threonine synthase [Anaerolineae bacterium]|nr:threonine synthase [Anaerolineae bacterium]